MSLPLPVRARTLWAKTTPYHPLWCHLLDVAAVCERVIDALGGVPGLADHWTIFLAAMHDIGKADPRFQNRDDDLVPALKDAGIALPDHKDTFRHETRSGEWIHSYLAANCGWSNDAARVAKQALQGHHGRFHHIAGTDSYDEESTFPKYFQDWRELREDLTNIVRGALDMDNHIPKQFEDASATGLKLTGLIVLSDWIASNEELFRYPILDRQLALPAYWKAAREEACRAVDLLEIKGVRGANRPIEGFCSVWPNITELRCSQAALERACKCGVAAGLVIIEAPMGEGKTESAVYLSEYWKSAGPAIGTYIALPTMATSNQMYDRYRRFLTEHQLGQIAPRLVHGMSWLVDDKTPERVPEIDSEDIAADSALAWEWFSPSKRALIAPEGVGTIDQALMGALNVKHGFLRLLGLSSKVLIIDEVHAYDEYMTVILERLLQWCRVLRVPIVMLSATLSRRQKARLVEAYGGSLPSSPGSDAYPLITCVPMDGNSEVRFVGVKSQPGRRIGLRLREGLLEDIAGSARLAHELVKHGGCACLLVNTVADAQSAYAELAGLMAPDELYLFHARFPAWRRSEIEKHVVGLFGKDSGKDGNPQRPARAVLVATQVVEQSLDLDFDVMVSQLAPIDLLLQRCGRLRRHKRDNRPVDEDVLHVLMPDTNTPQFGDTGFVYKEWILLRTMALLKSTPIFQLPQDFRRLVDGCYGDEELELSVAAEVAGKWREEWLLAMAHDAGEARLYLLPAPKIKMFSPAMTTETYDEESDQANSFFQAKTRLGDRTRSVLLIEDAQLLRAAGSKRVPPRDVLARLFENKADIPAWWIKDVTPRDGFGGIVAGAKWLGGTVIIPVRGGVWKGMRQDKPIEIRMDAISGVRIGIVE